MKTKNDGHLLNEYDMIDANFRIENTNHKDSDSLNAGLNQGSCEQSSYRNAKGKRVWSQY